MSYLLDTNVVSETIRRNLNKAGLSWLDHELSGWFEGRVLRIDLAVADRWGRLLAEIGRPVPTVDSLLAATALHHDLRLVTRNAKDFYYPGLEVINPWSSTL